MQFILQCLNNKSAKLIKGLTYGKASIENIDGQVIYLRIHTQTHTHMLKNTFNILVG